MHRASAAVAVTLSTLASVVAGAVLGAPQPGPADASLQGGASSRGASTAWAETCFATLCLHGLLDLRWLMCARGVSRSLRDAVDRAFSLLPGITFPAHVTGPTSWPC